MSIIKGTNQIVAGFGGTKRSIGEVYFSQSSLATDNPGALPGWTGEYYENGKTLFPDLYNFVKAHSELQVTKAQYDSAIATYGECPKYVVDENSGTTTGTITVYGWLARGSTFYTKARNPVAGDSVWSSTDTTQETDYTVISLSNDTLTFSGPTREWSGTYSTTTTGTGLVTTPGTSLRLPKYANYIKMANSTEGIKNIEAGLPNITGYLASIDTGGRWGLIANASADDYNKYSGAFAAQNNGNYTQSVSTGKGVASGDLYFDASRSSAVYGKSSTVTPAATTLYPWVVAYTAAIPASTAQAAEFQQGLSGKADTNLGNIPSNYDYVVESQVNADGSWYRKYKSGWLEQGGGFGSNDATNTIVTLLKPYANTTYSIMVGQMIGSSGDPTYWNFAVFNKTTSTVTIHNSTNGAGNICQWEAKGMGAN